MSVVMQTTTLSLKWFSSNVRRNLHVVFCLEDLCSASTTASPALFNRCVVDWFGTWSTSASAHVGDALLADVDVDQLGAWDEREQCLWWNEPTETRCCRRLRM